MSADLQRCDRCDLRISEDARRKGWPIPTLDGTEYVCPSCYGDEAFCPEGHVLHADTEGDDCEDCAQPTTLRQALNERAGRAE